MKMMMRAAATAAAILFAANVCLADQADTTGGLISPPAINIPHGGMVVTEVNLSDNDVLGIIKQVLPTLANTMQNIPAESLPGQPAVQALAGSVDLGAIGQVIDGIKGVRFIVAKYEREISPADMIKQFGDGIAKTGKFSKVASDFAFVPGVFGLYAQENNAGYVGFMYDHKGKVLYAARIVGSVDIPKLVELTSKIGKLRGQATAPEIPQAPAEPEPPTGE